MKPHDLYSPKPARGWLPWAAIAPVIGLLFLIASDVVGDPVLRHFVRLDAKGLPTDIAGFSAFLLISSLSLLMILLLWILLVERRSLSTIGWSGPGRLRGFVRGHLIGMASIIGIVGAIWLLRGLALGPGGEAAAAAWTTPGAMGSIVVLLLCFALQASTEEIFFRGWLLSVLAKKANLLLAIVVSSALFALAHFSRGQHWLVTISNALFGVFCCAWVVRTRNLFGVMGWHAGWNWLLAVGFGLPVTGFDMGIPALLIALQPTGVIWLSGGTHGPEGSIVCVAYFIAGIALLSLRRKPK